MPDLPGAIYRARQLDVDGAIDFILGHLLEVHEAGVKLPKEIADMRTELRR